MRKFNTILFSLLVLVATTNAQAESNRFSISLGGSIIFDNFDTGGTCSCNFDHSSGVDFKLGAMVSDNLELGADILYINGFHENTLGLGLSVDGTAYTVDAKFLRKQNSTIWYFVAGLGLGNMEAINSTFLVTSGMQTGLIAKLGGGLEYPINQSVSIYTELSYYATSGDIDGVDFIPLTAGVKFNL